MRIYVAGPMTGLPGLNFDTFHAKTAELSAEGHTVINPAEIDCDPAAGWNVCMRADIAQLVTCDAVYMLPGWTNSRGATLEHHIASALSMQVLGAVDCGVHERNSAPAPDMARPLPSIPQMGVFSVDSSSMAGNTVSGVAHG